MIDRLRRITLLRYLLASVGALAVDMGSFLALLALGVVPVLASAAGYSLGIVAHWLLSSRAVFTDSVAEERGARTRPGCRRTRRVVDAGTVRERRWCCRTGGFTAGDDLFRARSARARRSRGLLAAPGR